MVFLVDSTDHITGKTGQSAALLAAVKFSKNGAAFATGSGTSITERGNGWYAINASATDTDTLGDLVINAAVAGCDPLDTSLGEVVAYNPFDGVRMGMTALPNAAAEAAGGLYTRGSGAGQINQPANGQIDTNLVRWKNATPDDLITTALSYGVNRRTVPTRAPNPALGLQPVKLSETTAERRRIFFWLHDSTGKPLTGVTWSSTGSLDATYWLQLTKNGAAPVEASGSNPTEVDATTWPGLYYYEATQSELDTVGRLGVQPYVNSLVS